MTQVWSRSPSVVAAQSASVSPAISFRLVSSSILKSNSLTSISGMSLLSWDEQQRDDQTSGDQLRAGRDPARAVPALDAMRGEELATAGSREGQDVLEVRNGGGRRSDH